MDSERSIYALKTDKWNTYRSKEPMNAKVCAILECGAKLLGMNYWALELTDGRKLAVCPTCYRKIRKGTHKARTIHKGIEAITPNPEE